MPSFCRADPVWVFLSVPYPTATTAVPAFYQKMGFKKESVIKRVESGEMIPNDKLIEKIEKFLQIKLTIPYEEKKIIAKPVRGKLTIGDVVEVE